MPAPVDDLSPAELRIAVACARGLGNRAVGAELYVSVNTVKTHLQRMLRRNDLHNKTQLVAVLMCDEWFRTLVTSGDPVSDVARARQVA